MKSKEYSLKELNNLYQEIEEKVLNSLNLPGLNVKELDKESKEYKIIIYAIQLKLKEYVLKKKQGIKNVI